MVARWSPVAPKKLTTIWFLGYQGDSSDGRFDFVHFPRDQQTGLNVALAFVNFVDHEAAANALRTQLMSRRSGRRPLGPARIRPGTVQGLGPNLAYFISRFGLDALEGPSAPLIFDRGQRVPTLLTLRKHMTLDMLREHIRDPVVMATIGNQLSWMFPKPPSSPTAACASGEGMTTMSHVQALLEGNRSDVSIVSPGEPSNWDALVSSSSPAEDLGGSSNQSEIGSVPASLPDAALEDLPRYREGGKTVFQL